MVMRLQLMVMDGVWLLLMMVGRELQLVVPLLHLLPLLLVLALVGGRSLPPVVVLWVL
jgi:hypothetical protein